MRDDAGPAYYRIYLALRGRIVSSKYPAGSKLPTDSAIVAEFGVSRHTARSAVERLVAERLVRRFPGRGSFILRNTPDEPDWSASTIEDLRIMDPAARYVLKLADKPPAPRAAGAREHLQLDASVRVFCIAWTRELPVGPIAYCEAFVPPTVADRLPADLEQQLQQSWTVALIERCTGLVADRVRQVSRAVPASKHAARMLQVPSGTPVLLLERTWIDTEGVPFYYSELFVRSDRYQPSIDLFRRARASSEIRRAVIEPQPRSRARREPAAQASRAASR